MLCVLFVYVCMSMFSEVLMFNWWCAFGSFLAHVLGSSFCDK